MQHEAPESTITGGSSVSVIEEKADSMKIEPAKEDVGSE
jgi:hypothetical protein